MFELGLGVDGGKELREAAIIPDLGAFDYGPTELAKECPAAT
jgi:hypothetical protein